MIRLLVLLALVYVAAMGGYALLMLAWARFLRLTGRL